MGAGMPRTHVDDQKLSYFAFLNAERGRRHHTQNEDMLQYDLMRAGDPKAVEECRRMLDSDLPGHVSEDPLRNQKYLFVASIALVSRYCIEDGMDSETAYNASDLYILRMDQLRTVEEVKDLHCDMFAFYTGRMANIKKEQVFSLPVIRCQDYIRYHLDATIHLSELAEHVGLNESYLSTLFKRETGLTVTEYVQRERIDTAKNMLKYSDYSAMQIATALGYSSQSYFTRVFRATVGMTPTEYRRRYHHSSGFGG